MVFIVSWIIAGILPRVPCKSHQIDETDIADAQANDVFIQYSPNAQAAFAQGFQTTAAPIFPSHLKRQANPAGFVGWVSTPGQTGPRKFANVQRILLIQQVSASYCPNNHAWDFGTGNGGACCGAPPCDYWTSMNSDLARYTG
jgi:hypothetical protein